MTDTVGSTPTGIEPESGKKLPPYTEPAPDDAEGHATKLRPYAEDAPDDAEGFGRKPFTEDDDADTEGHMPLTTKPGPGEQSVETAGIEPDGGWKRPLTEDDDTEGHMPLKRVFTEPGPDEPGAEDAEGHMPMKRGALTDDDAPMESDVNKSGLPDEAEDADDVEGHKRQRRT